LPVPSPPPPPPVTTPSGGCGDAQLNYNPFWGGFTVSAGNLGAAGNLGNVIAFQFSNEVSLADLQITVEEGSNPWNCAISPTTDLAANYLAFDMALDNAWSCGVTAYIANPQPASVSLIINGNAC